MKRLVICLFVLVTSPQAFAGNSCPGEDSYCAPKISQFIAQSKPVPPPATLKMKAGKLELEHEKIEMLKVEAGNK